MGPHNGGWGNPHTSGNCSWRRRGRPRAHCPGLASGHHESWARRPSLPYHPTARAALRRKSPRMTKLWANPVQTGQQIQMRARGPPTAPHLPLHPLTGHRHRPPQSPCCSRRHWSHADPALGLGDSPGCAGRSPARDRPSPTLSPKATQQWPRSRLTKSTARGLPNPGSCLRPPCSSGGKCGAFILTSPLKNASRVQRQEGLGKTPGPGLELDPVLTQFQTNPLSSMPPLCTLPAG